MKFLEWVRCPVCGSKTRDRIREDTILRNYPLYCPKCKQQTLIEVQNLQVTVIKESDAHRLYFYILALDLPHQCCADAWGLRINAWNWAAICVNFQ